MSAGGLTTLALAVLLGGGIGAGLWSMLAALPTWSAATLVRRVAPYTRDIADRRGMRIVDSAELDPGSGLAVIARAAWRGMRSLATTIVGDPLQMRQLIRRAGWQITPEALRARQLAAAVGCAAVTALLGVVAAVAGNRSPGFLLLPAIAAAAGFAGVGFWLRRAATRRSRQASEELPTVLDFLALCLAAGEGLTEAIARSAHAGTGVIPHELQAALIEIGTGATHADALAACAARVEAPGFTRAVDHISAALERGAPLAEVLRDQAGDAREEHKQAMLARAGRKEILMMLPLVFLVLPLSVVLAIYPGVEMLKFGF